MLLNIESEIKEHKNMRSSVLKLLRSRAGNYISGEEIAKHLNVSRTAIWKHIRELKQTGYEIVSHAKRGYALMGTPDSVSYTHLDVYKRQVHIFSYI